MTIYLSEEQERAWLAVSESIRLAADQLSQAQVDALLKLTDAGVDHDTVARVSKRIESAINSGLSGLAYLCHPQPEWTGNDASGNYTGRVRAPHIAQSTWSDS